MPKAREAFGQTAAPGKIARPRAAARTPSDVHQRNSGPPPAPCPPLARPPCVTSGQLFRVAILVLGAAFYADRAASTTGWRLFGDQSQSAANVDDAPTASIGPAGQTEQGSPP